VSKSWRVPIELQVGARHLGHRRRLVLDQVEDPVAGTTPCTPFGQILAGGAADHRGLRRDAEDAPALRQLPLLASALRSAFVSKSASREPTGPATSFFLRSNRYQPRTRPASPSPAGSPAARTGTPSRREALRVARRADEVLLEVVQLELGRLADDRGGRARVADAGQRDDDLVWSLLADLLLADAELVDAGSA
jgi:hypothetical protein